jgi:hypothetical protein
MLWAPLAIGWVTKVDSNGAFCRFQNVLSEVFSMSDARIRGVVHLIEGTKTYGQKGFRKRMVVVEQNNARFTNYIPLEFTNEGCDSVDNLHVGDEAEFVYRLSGRKWQKDPESEVKFFLSAEAISYKVLTQKAAPNGAPPPSENEFVESFDDEVPF